MDEYQDITHELDALMVRDEPIAALGPDGYLHNLPPEVLRFGDMLRIAGSLAVIVIAVTVYLLTH